MQMRADRRGVLVSALLCLALVNRVHAGRFDFGWVHQRTSAMAPSKSASPSPPQATPTSPGPAPPPLPQNGAMAPTPDVSDIPFVPFDELNIPNLEDILNADATDDGDGEQEEQEQPGDAAPINSTTSKTLPVESTVPSSSVSSEAAATTASSSICDYRCLFSFCQNNEELCRTTIIEAGNLYCRFFSGCPDGRPAFSRVYIPFSPFGNSAQSSGANPFSVSSTEGSISSPIIPLEDVQGEVQTPDSATGVVDPFGK